MDLENPVPPPIKAKCAKLWQTLYTPVLSICMSMHTCRCRHVNVSTGILVHMSTYMYMCSCVCVGVRRKVSINGLKKNPTLRIINFLVANSAKCVSFLFDFPDYLLLLLRSPATSLGFTSLGEIFCECDRFFNPTIEAVTVYLHGWCVLGVFLLPHSPI